MKDFIKKYGIGAVTFGVTLDSYRRTVSAHTQQLAAKDAKLAAAKAKFREEFSDMAAKQAEVTNKLLSSVPEYTKVDDELTKWNAKYKTICNKLISGNYEHSETRESLLIQQKICEHNQSELGSRHFKNQQEFQKFIDSLGENGTFDWLWDLIENYRLFLSTLNLDQIVAVLNLIGHLVVLNAVISITLILAGSYLINNYNIEKKYPKLAFFIKTRQKLTKAYLWTHVIFLFIFLFLNIGANLYVIFNRYFL
jgi:uncharacterized protein YbcV (DUF1398 family)